MGEIISDNTQLNSISAMRFVPEDLTGKLGNGGDMFLRSQGILSGISGITFSDNGNSGNVNILGDESLVVRNINFTASGQINIVLPSFDSFFDIPTLEGQRTQTLDINPENFSQSGNILISSPENISFDNTVFLSDANGSVPAGYIIVNAPGGVTLLNNSEINSNTNATGTGGSIIFNTPEITLESGTSITASTRDVGAGGSLIVNSESPLTIQGPGTLTVSSLGENSGPGGNLSVNAPQLFLNNGVTLAATTESTQGGGNIVLTVPGNLVMRRGSLINAESTNPIGGDSGSIFIDTNFLIAAPGENNDIIANAVGGIGGRIVVNAANIFNFSESRGFTTSQLRSNTTNDLSATSAFGIEGSVNLNVDANPSLEELPEDFVDASELIAETLCESGLDSEFTVSGRGGIPRSPTDSLGSLALWEDWVISADEDASANTFDTANIGIRAEEATPLVEAQGAVRGAGDRIYLLPNAPATTANAGAIAVGRFCDRQPS
jgi:hypothetical protein